MIKYAFLSLSTGCFACAFSAAATEKPHVLIVLVDDMGYGDPGCYGADSKIPTPNIDRLAREGMRFTDAHAPGALCHLSRYGLLTGCYPFRTDTARWREQPSIREGQMTIASLLRDQGYRTAMVGKWHLGFDEQGYDQPLNGGPVDRGFDTFFGIRASTDIPPYFYIRDRHAVAPPTEPIAAHQTAGWSPIQGEFWREGEIAPGMELKDVLPRFTDEAAAVIEDHSRQRRGERLLLYLAYPSPHTPWLPSEQFVGKSQAGMYGDFAAMVDFMIGRVLQSLDAAQMADETLVVFTSDNGPVWYESDVVRFGHDCAGGWRGMKGDAWEAGHRMPFVVRWPGRVAQGSVSAKTICFTDVLATLAAITGVPLPVDAGADSFDFSPTLLGVPAAEGAQRRAMVVSSASGTLALRSGPWKFIPALGSQGFSLPRDSDPIAGGAAGQLYHLGDDPLEQTNLYLEHGDVVRRLEAQLAEIQSSARSR